MVSKELKDYLDQSAFERMFWRENQSPEFEKSFPEVTEGKLVE